MLLPDDSLVLIEWRHRVNLHAEDVLLDVMWQRLDLIRRMRVRRHRKDLVQLLKRERFRFGDKEQDSKKIR